MSILSGNARLAGIVGWPVLHSRSPQIHGFWLQRYGIDGAYVPLSVRENNFAEALRGLAMAGFAGVNVTMPHKLAAFEICHNVDETARRAGAANTLDFRHGRIEGRNTDGFGFIANLQDHGIDPLIGPALVLGAGGAARAIAATLAACSVPVAIANRTRDRAEELVRDVAGLTLVEWGRRGDVLADISLLVNSTSLGMTGHPALEIDLDRASPGLVVADTVYVPLETPLLAAARARGLRVVEGLGMLLHQARPGFAAWFGAEPTVDRELRSFIAADLSRP
ncbi:MAG: shikimate dehydrogenase [Pseudomonadota bacterium]|nr:shikimate dehydrogenase [Pseudomonadota bacterium]